MIANSKDIEYSDTSDGSDGLDGSDESNDGYGFDDDVDIDISDLFASFLKHRFSKGGSSVDRLFFKNFATHLDFDDEEFHDVNSCRCADCKDERRRRQARAQARKQYQFEQRRKQAKRAGKT